MSPLARIGTYVRLGPRALARVGYYRLLLRAGRHPVQRIVPASVPHGPFFTAPPPRDDLPRPNDRWSDKLCWFDWYSEPRPAGAPDWHHNPFGSAPGAREGDWWTIPDFAGTGDIKGVWELSRFGWLVAFATQAAHGDAGALATMNAWLDDWAHSNLPYAGANWKCGQEASIRALHLVAAAMLLEQDRRPTLALIALVRMQLARIAPTMSYALGQDNNHGTSEAAAMFVGGTFLAANGVAVGRRWSAIGRRWLNERACRLILRDGSFSQYSLTYHRLMLDSYVFVEAWRRRHALAPLAPRALARLARATDWFDAMVDRATGDAPNLGANDGARLLPITVAGYRDFRPTLAAASALFRARATLAPGPWDDQLRWLGIPSPVPVVGDKRDSARFDDGGYLVLRAGRAAAYLRFPRFAFRPSQSDLLHLDLWVEGRNLLRDAGTYSYADETGAAFAGTAAHNTITFDRRDQMPRLGRFLFGTWPRAYDVSLRHEDDATIATAAYRDDRGMCHHRAVTLRADGFTCVDTVAGPFEEAVIRWRLMPGDYGKTAGGVVGRHLTLSIACDGEPAATRVTEGMESLHYLQRGTLPVLEATVSSPCRIVTTAQY